jgi:hypothetical protein
MGAAPPRAGRGHRVTRPARVPAAATGPGAAATLLDAGAILTLGSDWPIAPSDPRGIIAEAQLRRPADRPDLGPARPAQALTALQALHGYTTAPALTASAEHVSGRIAPGYRANTTSRPAHHPHHRRRDHPPPNQIIPHARPPDLDHYRRPDPCSRSTRTKASRDGPRMFFLLQTSESPGQQLAHAERRHGVRL